MPNAPSQVINIIKKPWFIIVTIVLALVAIIAFVVVPAIQDIQQLNKQIVEQRAQLESRYEKRLTIKNSIKNFNNLSPQIPGLLSSIFVNSGNEIEFITALESLADKNNLTQSINFDTKNGETSLENKRRVPVDITITGDYVNILKYISDTERLNFYFIIDHISSSAKFGDSSGIVRTMLKGHTYWKNKEELN